jgi:hypothetical protein
VVKWHPQYAESGLAVLENAPKPGGPAKALTDEPVCSILAATVIPPPESSQAQGVTHWPRRRLQYRLRGRERHLFIGAIALYSSCRSGA